LKKFEKVKNIVKCVEVPMRNYVEIRIEETVECS
jgi:hypothetical protein